MSEPRGVAGSSVVMFTGTLVSRLLGVVRSPLLLGAAIGINYGAANAFAVANKLPNVIYMLIAGGVLNAVLVPQIVRAIRLHDDGGQAYVNRLVTLAILGLGAITALLTVGAGVLVSIFAGSLEPQWYDLAVTFGYWCIPQVFFYGMYTVLGQILNARGIFGPYMWAPAVNNVVAILGLVVYLVAFGGVDATDATGAGIWTVSRVAVLTGTATLGVAAQAAVLLVPLRRSGFRFRPDLRLRGSGLGRASKVAMWVFAAVAVGQISTVAISRAAARASNVGVGALDVPGNAAYDTAYLVYSLPTSLVVVSLVTALFTRMAGNAAGKDLDAVRADLSLGLRTVGVFTVFAAGALIVLALPVVRVITGTVSYTEAQSIARVLVAMLVGLVGVGAFTVVQRVYYAFEDARGLFWLQVPMIAVVTVGALASMLLPPQWTVVGIGAAMALSNTAGAAVTYLGLRPRLRSLDGAHVLRTYLRLTLAVGPTMLVGWVLLRLFGTSGAELDVPGALWRTLVVGAVMVALYVALLRVLQVDELWTVLRPVASLVDATGRRAPAPAGPALLGAAAALRRLGGSRRAPADMRMRSAELDADGTGSPEPRLLGGRYELRAVVPDDGAPVGDVTRWLAHDTVLARDVWVLELTTSRAADALDAARRASLVEDHRLLRVLDVGAHPGASYVVTDVVRGPDLATIAAAGMSAVQARAVVGEAASALEAARRQGVRHQALRPSSLHVTPDGEVLVTGLGVDALLRGTAGPDDSPLTASRRDTVDLVRLVYLALTGVWPVSHPDDARPGDALGGAIVPPRELRADVPADLDALCTATLIEGKGPRSTGELIRLLAPWPDVDAALAHPVPPPAAAPTTATATTTTTTTEAPGAAAAAAPSPGDAPVPDDTAAAPTDDPAAADVAQPDESVTGGATAAAPAPPVGADGPPGAAPDQAAAGPRITRPAWTRVNDQADDPADAIGPPPGPPAADLPASDAPDVEHTDATGGATAPGVRRGAPGPATDHEAPELTRIMSTADQDAPASAPARHTRIADSLGELGTRTAGAARSAAAGIAAGSRRVSEGVRTLREGRPPDDEDLFTPPDVDGPEVPFTERRLDPTPVVLAVIGVIVLVLLLISIRILFAPPDPVSLPDPTPAAPTQTAPSPTPAADPTTPPVPPVIAALVPLDPQGDGAENPDLTGRALDGDPASFWRSRSYVNPQYGMKDGIGLAVTLEQPTLVSAVVIDLMGEGGLVEVRATTAADPTGGEVLADGPMGPGSVFELAEPVQTDSLVLWFPSLPVAASDGKNRLEIAELTLR
ncbi:MAG: murein biosynthesis integral membrane protein MurJ [Georgenia sp.]